MALEDYPVWSFPPNWEKSVTERFSWLTDILASRTGSEQRRALLQWPRREFEFSVMTDRGGRSMLSMMLARHTASTWYLPIWHEVMISEQPITAGDMSIAMPGANTTQIGLTKLLYITDGNPFNFELLEVVSASASVITLGSAPAKDWPVGSFIYPATIGHLTDAISQSKLSTNVMSASVRFLEVMTGRKRSTGTTTLVPEIYDSFPVLTLPPDETKNLTHDYDMIMTKLDNKTSTPLMRDDAGRVFFITQYGWILKNRADHNNFIFTIENLRGRAKAIWIPSFMDDFDLGLPIAVGATNIVVKPCGYNRSGGYGVDRRHIMIETLSGDRYFMRITGSAVLPNGNERLNLMDAVPVEINPSDILRFCFIELCRLNHDDVEILHHVDNVGVSEVNLTFRSAPNTHIQRVT